MENHTWNPISAEYGLGTVGHSCVKVSDGCKFCTAEAENMAKGTGLDFSEESMNDITHVLSKSHGNQGLTFPLRLKTSSVIRVNTMTDWLWDAIPLDWAGLLFATMSMATNHVFITQTRRYERLVGLLTSIAMTQARAIAVPAEDSYAKALRRVFDNQPKYDLSHKLLVRLTDKGLGKGYIMPVIHEQYVPFPPRNVVFGVSASNQDEMEKAIRMMRNLRATFLEPIKLMISYEPALGPVDFSPLQKGDIDWLEVGGEIGKGDETRMFDINWWFSALEFGHNTETPVYFKQTGSAFSDLNGLWHGQGANPHEWRPQWGFVQQLPAFKEWTV